MRNLIGGKRQKYKFGLFRLDVGIDREEKKKKKLKMRE